MKQSNNHLVILNHGKRTAERSVHSSTKKRGHNLTFDVYIYRVNRRREDNAF